MRRFPGAPRGALLLGMLWLGLAGCQPKAKPLASRSQTFAELRTIKRGVKVRAPNEAEREPYRRERLVDGEEVHLGAGGLAWLKRDGGATLLVAGPASFTLRAQSLDVARGKVFVDVPPGTTEELTTPRGALHLSAVRTSIEVSADGATEAYVLRGAVRTDSAVQAGPGERLTVPNGGKATTAPVSTWEDWTGGLATTDRAAEPAPFGIGTVGARRPGDSGQPRFPLSIQRLDVRVTVVDDFATTEVDEIFANPTGDTVEGLYGFRTPEGATLARFGVDRGHQLVWGRVKERQAAAAQYQANVYQGSTEDPALLEWDAPGVYRARLYPIAARETRRVVTRYAEWLGRQGPRGERRLYVYPMAAEGAEGSLPRIEELTISLDLERAHARDVRVGMSGKQQGTKITVKAFDFVPRADLAVELYDDGAPVPAAYRAPHQVDRDTTAADELEKAEKAARAEAPYLLVPIRPSRANEPPGGLDLAIVVDTSAATEPGGLAIARWATSALLSHLGPDDRAAIWAGDATLRAVSDGSDRFAVVDGPRREAALTGLSQIERGGATDLGAIVAEAASRLDAGRRGAVVYIGDGQPTVGELGVPELRERLQRLPRPVRLFGIGVGERANLGILNGISRGGFAVRVGDGHAAGEAALRVLEEAERPAWLGASVDLGPGIDRVFPRELGALAADETALVIGRIVGEVPKRVVVHGAGGDLMQPLTVRPLEDGGDLRRRWAEGRLVQLLDEGAGRAAVVEVGVRSGVITPFTSLYVPTAAERAVELRRAESPVAGGTGGDGVWSWLSPFSTRRNEVVRVTEQAAAPAREASAENKEGGTGTRAKGEEGSMGAPTRNEALSMDALPTDAVAERAPAAPAAAAAPAAQAAPRARMAEKRANLQGVEAAPSPEAKDDPARGSSAAEPHVAREQALREAMEFGMTGLMNQGAAGGAAEPAPSASGNLFGDAIGDAPVAGGLGLSGVGEGGGGHGDASGTVGRGGPAGAVAAVTNSGGDAGLRGLGSGQGRLGGSSATRAPAVRMGQATVSGRLPPEVVQRIVRQNYGRFRLCYEQGLAQNPALAGQVTVRFVIGADGALSTASDAGSSMPDAGVTSCVVRSFGGLSFPQPEGGVVTVVYPLLFSPGGGLEPATAPGELAGPLGAVGHVVVPCSPSAELPFDGRRALWRERLVAASGTVQGVMNVYHAALRGCEAPTWRERSQLLLMAVDALGTVRQRVALWQRFERNPSAADVIYRAILTRVHTAAQIRELHDALGMRQIDPAMLAKALADARTPGDRLALLRGLVAKWPDDLSLALTLLDAYEDAGDDGNGRALARRLRRRSDASTRVRTSVGEYYLRRGAKETGPAADRDVTEARRTFGEIVEFSPDDPGARRLLGDLLRAHGWFAEAFRQYETLARLAPDDTAVPLLLAAAAQGMGRIEEAIRWTEKAAGTGTPDPTSEMARTSRAMASAFLAWAREDAGRGGRKEELARLRERARRLTALDVPDGGAVRVVLTWEHPEVHPELWSGARGAEVPAQDGDPTLGVAETLVPRAGAGAFVELRLSREDAERAARLGAYATLTAVTDEGTDAEKIVRLPIAFAKVPEGVRERRRFRADGVSLTEEAVQ